MSRNCLDMLFSGLSLGFFFSGSGSLASGASVHSLPAPTPAFGLTEMAEGRGQNRWEHNPSFTQFWRVFLNILTQTVSMISCTVGLAQLCHEGTSTKHLEISLKLEKTCHGLAWPLRYSASVN